jgi:hypothetical protein
MTVRRATTPDAERPGAKLGTDGPPMTQADNPPRPARTERGRRALALTTFTARGSRPATREPLRELHVGHHLARQLQLRRTGVGGIITITGPAAKWCRRLDIDVGAAARQLGPDEWPAGPQRLAVKPFGPVPGLGWPGASGAGSRSSGPRPARADLAPPRLVRTGTASARSTDPVHSNPWRDGAPHRRWRARRQPACSRSTTPTTTAASKTGGTSKGVLNKRRDPGRGGGPGWAELGAGRREHHGLAKADSYLLVRVPRPAEYRPAGLWQPSRQ